MTMNRMLVVLPACLLLFSGCLLEEGNGSPSSDDEEAFAAHLSQEPITATRDDNLAFGNPSTATISPSNVDNFLMIRPQYALSFNNSKGSANWVSWHLSTAWKGSAPRSSTFTADKTLPAGFVKVASNWYTNTGFDRGHLCPSDDRDASINDNKATFMLTNIVPQAPINNQKTWLALEYYSRALVTTGKELYIVAGPGGIGGTGSVGAASFIHANQVTVPDFLWKIIVVLAVGSNDVTRVAPSTRVIAVKMPNDQTVNEHPWDAYRVSVDEIEALTGFDFLSNVEPSVQAVIEASVDNAPIN
jgi:endonuclease G, mitochondrial